MWITLYALYIVFILISTAAFYAEETVETRAHATGTYEYNLYFPRDGVIGHYTVTRTFGGEQPGKIHVIFYADTDNLYVETTNIQKLSIDCRSIAKEKTQQILGLDYSTNQNYYKTYFIEEVPEFVVTVNADNEIGLTFEDVPYPSLVKLNENIILEEGNNYTYENGDIKNVVAPEGLSVVKIYFAENSDKVTLARFQTDKKDFHHIKNSQILFDATLSEGEIETYLWDMGDGNFSEGPNPIHSYSEDNDYVVILVVRDTDGKIARTSEVIHVFDVDGDNLPDTWETFFFGDTQTESRTGDYDRDGLRNSDEYRFNTNPTNKDSDLDGFTDKEEIDADTDPNDRLDKPTTKEEDDSLFGMGKIGGIDLFILILIIIIIIIIIIVLAFSRRKGGAEREELVEEQVVEEVEEEEEVEEAEEAEEEEESYTCPECNAIIFEDQPTCSECGATLEWEDEEEEAEEEKEEEKEKEIEEEEEFECPDCGASLSAGETVCPQCGAEFEEEEEKEEESGEEKSEVDLEAELEKELATEEPEVEAPKKLEPVEVEPKIEEPKEKEPVEKEEEEEEEEEEEFECPTCGTTVSEEDTVCPTCGEEFE